MKSKDVTKYAKKDAKCFALSSWWSEDTLKIAAFVASFRASVAESLLKFVTQIQKITGRKSRSFCHFLQSSEKERNAVSHTTVAMLVLRLCVRKLYWLTENNRRTERKDVHLHEETKVKWQFFMINFEQHYFYVPSPKKRFKFYGVFQTGFLKENYSCTL